MSGRDYLYVLIHWLRDVPALAAFVPCTQVLAYGAEERN